MDYLVLFAWLNICLIGCPIFGQNVCSTSCSTNRHCVQDNVTVVWELSSSNECKTYQACYGSSSDYPDDTTTNIFAGRFYPIVIASGASVYFKAKYTSTILQPFKIYDTNQTDFLGCNNDTGSLNAVATLTTAVKVDNKFLSSSGYKFFIATGRGHFTPCNLGLRLHLNVKNATNCSGVSVLPPGGQLCSGKGKCISESFTGGMHCECCPGYTGWFCEELDACYTEPCQRGNCSDVIAGHSDAFNCTCEVGYTGHACDIDINECAENNVVCQNGGFCDDGVNSYECLCRSGYHGRHCEFVSNMCDLIKPCKNNGNCSRVGPSKESYVCHCAAGFYGRNCTLNTTTTSLIPQPPSVQETSSYQTASSLVPSVMFSSSSSPKYQVTASSHFASTLTETASSNTVSQFYSSMKTNPILLSTTESGTYIVATSSVISRTSDIPNTYIQSLYMPGTSSVSDGLLLTSIPSSSMNQISYFFSTYQSVTVNVEDTLSAVTDTTVAQSATLSDYSLSEVWSTSMLSVDHILTTVSTKSSLIPLSPSVFTPSKLPSSDLRSSLPPVFQSLTSQLEVSQPMAESLSSIHPVSMTTSLEQTLTIGLSMSPTTTVVVTPLVLPSLQLPSPSVTIATTLVTHPNSEIIFTKTRGSTLPTPPYLPSSGLISPSVSLVIPSTTVTPTQPPFENQTCADGPCGVHGVCTNRVSSVSGVPFHCDCQYPTVGPFCTTDLELHFPYFNGNSYIKYRPIAFGSTINEFVISFRTEAEGTILFSGHTTYRDFMKLDVIGGHLRFSVDAGDKVVSVTSREDVVSGNTTAASFGYDTRTGSVFMSVNNGPEQRATTRGKLRDVLLNFPLFLGGIIPAIYTQNKPDAGAVNTPFVGCVRELEFNERAFELSDAVDWQNISECDVPACHAMPCKNGGLCVQTTEDPSDYSCQCSYPYSGKNCGEKFACEVNVCNGGKCLNTSSSGVECLCPFGRGGVTCNQEIEVSIPTFSVVNNHSSYLQYLTPRAVVDQLDLRMEIKFANNASARGVGLLFYVGLHDHLSVGSDGDYLALGVVGNQVVLQFNLGSGGTSITSDELSYDQEWFTILAGRKGREGYLYVDNDIKEGRSPPPLVALNVFGNLYLGGVPEFSMLNSEVIFTEGFRGSIKDPKVRTGLSNSWLSLVMDHSTDAINSVAVVTGLNIQDQRVNACVVDACVNNGTCQSLGASYVCRCLPMWSGMTCNDTSVPCRDYNPCRGRSTCRMRDSGFTCDCPPGKVGRYCDNDVNITTPYFGEYSYLSLSLAKIKIYSQTSLTLAFSTSAVNGILFYVTHDITSLSGDFLSITLHDGHVYLIYNLGTGVGKCRSENKILSNQVNNISVSKDARRSTLVLNGNLTSCTSRGGATQLNVDSVFYLGGVPDLSGVQPMAYENTRDLRDFTGCVEQLVINDHSFDLTRRGILDGRNIVNCDTIRTQA